MRNRIRGISQNSVVKYGAASLFARGTAIISTIILTPLIMGNLGAEKYGIWYLSTLIPTIIAFPDLGISNGIVNKIAEIKREHGGISGFFGSLVDLERLLSFVSLIWFLVGLTILYLYTQSFSTAAGDEIFQSLLIALIIFCLGIAPTFWTKVQLALEIGHQSVVWEGIGKLLSLISSAAVILIYPDLRFLVITTLLPPVLTSYVNAVKFKIPYKLQENNQRRKTNISKILENNLEYIRSGGYFTTVQIAYIIGFALDNFIIGRLMSVDTVGYVSVARRPFDALPLVVTLFSTALWPVFNRLQAQGEFGRASEIVSKLVTWPALAIASASLLILLYKDIIYGFLSQDLLTISSEDIFWIAVKTLAVTAVIILQNYVNASNLIKNQAIIQILSSIIIIVAVIYFISQGDVTGYLMSTALIYFVTNLIPMALLVVSDIKDKVHKQVTVQESG